MTKEVKDPFFSSRKGTKKLAKYFEYVVKGYPVKRENFVDFHYKIISFYSTLNFDDCYFTNFELKGNTDLELSNIGENKWIFMI